LGYRSESLIDIFNKYNSDKNISFHNYSRQYENLFKEYRTKPINFLEIGVFQGESIKIWREVFPNATKIVGVDINPECKKYEDISKSIFVEIGDASNPEFIQFIMNKYGPFDIVIDDGSHTNKDVIHSFELIFPTMNDDSLYVVEDTICFKSAGYIDNNYPNHLVYFAKYLPYLNQWRFDSSNGIFDHCVDPFKIQKKAENIFEASIDMITYGVSFIAINKKIRKHWI
jgi:hypothetical protein